MKRGECVLAPVLVAPFNTLYGSLGHEAMMALRSGIQHQAFNTLYGSLGHEAVLPM